MYSKKLFEIADECIERGFFPQFTGCHYVLGVHVMGTGYSIIHKKHVNFRLHVPCRVWLVSGKKCALLGDSDALPGELEGVCRPPWTG